MKKTLTLSVLTFFVLSLPNQARALDYFVSADFAQTRTKISEVRFSPSFQRLKIGALFEDKGIGFELIGASSASSDDRLGIEVDITSFYGGAFRFQSVYDSGYRAYAEIGGSSIDIEVLDLSNPTLNEKQTLTGPYFGIGLQGQLKFMPKLALFGEYNHFFKDDNIRMGAFALGLQFNF